MRDGLEINLKEYYSGMILKLQEQQYDCTNIVQIYHTNIEKAQTESSSSGGRLRFQTRRGAREYASFDEFYRDYRNSRDITMPADWYRNRPRKLEIASKISSKGIKLGVMAGLLFFIIGLYAYVHAEPEYLAMDPGGAIIDMLFLGVPIFGFLGAGVMLAVMYGTLGYYNSEERKYYKRCFERDLAERQERDKIHLQNLESELARYENDLRVIGAEADKILQTIAVQDSTLRELTQRRVNQNRNAAIYQIISGNDALRREQELDAYIAKCLDDQRQIKNRIL